MNDPQTVNLSKIQKKAERIILPAVKSARDETRTHTSQLTLAPETSASTIPPPAHQMDCKYSDFL